MTVDGIAPTGTAAGRFHGYRCDPVAFISVSECAEADFRCFYFLSGRSFLGLSDRSGAVLFLAGSGHPPAASLTHIDGGTTAATGTLAFRGGFLVRQHFQRQLLKKDKCFSFLPSPVHLPPSWMDRTRTLPGGPEVSFDCRSESWE